MNHSNDATLVKNFHLWGKKNKIPTSTIHDAFFTNAGEMLTARTALREIYTKALDADNIKKTLDEMRKRGFPEELYKKYLDEAIDKGLIPVPGRSSIGGRVIQEDDLLKKEDILKSIREEFNDDAYWYGVG